MINTETINSKIENFVGYQDTSECLQCISGDINGDSVIPKPFYTGFLGKVIANTIFFSTIVIFMPLLNGGPAGFLAVLEWRYIDRSIMANVKYFIWTLNLGLPIIAVGFEAMMFVYASTKDTVLGIDDRLRKTFTNTIFTGVGAIAFIAASEIMENLLGFGLLGTSQRRPNQIQKPPN